MERCKSKRTSDEALETVQMTMAEAGSGCGKKWANLTYGLEFSPEDLLMVRCQHEEKDGNKDVFLVSCPAFVKWNVKDAIYWRRGRQESTGLGK